MLIAGIGFAAFTVMALWWLKTYVDEQVREFSQASAGRDTSLANKLVEMRNKHLEFIDTVNDEIVIAKTKSETAYQLAHQAHVKAKQSRTMRLQIEPLVFRVKKSGLVKKDPQPENKL